MCVYVTICIRYCSTYYKAVREGGTREEPATLTQGGALFSLSGICRGGPRVCVDHSLSRYQRVAAQRKINAYKQQYVDNQNISFLPVIVSTSCRMHGEFLRLLFLQAHRETEANFTANGMSSQRNQSD